MFLRKGEKLVFNLIEKIIGQLNNIDKKNIFIIKCHFYHFYDKITFFKCDDFFRYYSV